MGMIAVPRSHPLHFPARNDRLFIGHCRPFLVDPDTADLGLGLRMAASMQKVIAYQDRAEEWRRRTSEETNAQQREANERIATAWESLARLREKQLKEGTARPVF